MDQQRFKPAAGVVVVVALTTVRVVLAVPKKALLGAREVLEFALRLQKAVVVVLVVAQYQAQAYSVMQAVITYSKVVSLALVATALVTMAAVEE